MFISPRSRPTLLLFIALPFGLYALFNFLMGGTYVLAIVGSNYMEDKTVYCRSAAEARATSAWVDTVLIVPSQIHYGHWEITFDQCWLEQLRESHRSAWYKPRTLRWEARSVFHLGYHARYFGPGKLPEMQARPLLTSAQGIGGQYLQQGAEQWYTVYADILPDSTLNIVLPLDLRLEDRPNQPDCQLQAYPASYRN